MIPSQGHLQFVMLLSFSQSNCSCSPMRFIGMWFKAVQGLWCQANLTLRLHPLMMTFQPGIVIALCSPFTNGLKKSEVVISKYDDEWESPWLTGDFLTSLLKVCHMVNIVSIALFKSCFENFRPWLFKITATTLLISHLENQRSLSWIDVDTYAYI